MLDSGMGALAVQDNPELRLQTRSIVWWGERPPCQASVICLSVLTALYGSCVLATSSMDSRGGVGMRKAPGRYDLGDRERFRQRRRRSKPLPPMTDGIDHAFHQDFDEVSDLVPEIGDGLRWYDYPYRFLSWLLWGRPKRLFGQKARDSLLAGINRLHPYNELDRHRAESLVNPMHNVFVPVAEHVNVPGVWVVELFPPTDLPSLQAALTKNGWDKAPFNRPAEGGNNATLGNSRAQGGAGWWRVIDLVRPNSGYVSVDAVHAELPEGIDLVEIQARQVGASLTAIVARFRPSKEAAAALDSEWHRPHEPRLVRGERRARPLDRQWAAFLDTQEFRRAQHDMARNWLSDQLPGYFASRDRAQPVLDLMLFDHFDPTLSQEKQSTCVAVDHFSNALRALGLSDHDLYLVTSASLPKLALAQSDVRMHEGLGDAPLWTLSGKRTAVIEALGPGGLAGYSSDRDQAIASSLVDSMFSTLVMLAVSEFTRVARSEYAAVRDTASVQHLKYRPRALSELRSVFLAQSINVATVSYDVSRFWERSWNWDGDATFKSSWAPTYRERDKASGRKSPKSSSFNKRVRAEQEEAFRRLLQEDRDYRDILSTVATLGASADASRVGRLALWVALASLVTATVASIDFAPGTVLGGAINVVTQFLEDFWP